MQKHGHTKDTCWDIYGKPADWKPRSNGRDSWANNATTDSTSQPKSNPFSKEQLDLLQKLLQQSLQPKPPQPTSITGTGSIAQKGNFLSALNAKQKRTRPWIVDSGASDHMTGDANVFDTYDPCFSNYFVCIADG